MSKHKVELASLFRGKNDIRKHLRVDMTDELKEYFGKEFDICIELVEKMMEEATIYLDYYSVFKTIEIELEDD